MTTHVALLRGINLGARRRVAMADLRQHLTAAGFAEVRTFQQSGNVLLRSDAHPTELERALEAAIAERFELETRVVSRTAGELARIVAGDPFGEVADDPRRYQVSFLDGEPDPEAVRTIEAAAVAPERVAFRGREVYAWHPGGILDSPVAKLLADRRLGVTATARNWRTVTKLLELAG